MIFRNRSNRICQTLVMLAVAFVLGERAGDSQQAPAPQTFTLDRAIRYALDHYPAVRAAQQRFVAAQGQTDLARTTYLPSLQTLWQSNRATRNNIFGQLLPQSVIPSISGPVLPFTSGASVWGSAGGMLLSWEPFDFGLRGAQVQAARAGERGARAQSDLTQLDVAGTAAQAFLAVVATQQVVRAARANVERRQVFAQTVHVLVKNELRPGADASRADAELARARTLLIQAETSEAVSQAAFAEILGLAGTAVQVEAGMLLGPPPSADVPASPLTAHPAAEAEQAQVEQTRAQAREVARSYVPRFFTQAAVSGRGSGANTDGTVASGPNGLGLERGNWAAGLTVTFPVFDYFSLRARKKIAGANEKAEQARYEQTLQGLSEQVAQAQAVLQGARRVAENTPVELAAAQASETQARARYQAGLATIVEVADAQGLLVQAEIDDALARLNVWHGLEGVAAAQGNLQPFIGLLAPKTP